MSLANEIDQEILELLRKRLPLKAIRKTVGLTKHGLYQRMKRMRAAVEASGYEHKSSTIESLERSIFGYCNTVETNPLRASRHHLADVKRDGYATIAEYRRRCEYHIPGDELRPLGPVSRPISQSLCGSPAAWCDQ
jgi:chorismate mutase